MECLKCGANLKDNALVCNKCGFVMKGAKKLENTAPQMSFEEWVENASADELRASLLALKEMKDASKASAENKNTLTPEQQAVRNGKRWATTSLVCGIASLVCMVIPGINVILSLIFFVLAFMGFGKSNGHKTNLALVGLVLTIVSIAGSWIYNVYLGPTVTKMLGIEPGTVAEEGAEAVGQAADAAATAAA